MLCRFSFRISCFRRNNFIRSKCSTINNVPVINKEEPRSAGIIVIGDEILKGQVHDTNSYFIVKNLYKLGVKVQKIAVIGDIEDTIANEVKTFSREYTYVITTGGIGPTHDDITFQAVAKAFDEPLVPHPELVKLISDYYKTNDLSSAAMKMAHIPKSARITYGYDKVKARKSLFPNVSIKNVYMFPGIPQLMEKLFDLLCEDLFGGGSRHFFMKELYINAPEADIASTLNMIVAEFPQVNFGSYPKFLNRYFRVKITVESEREEEMDRAYKKLKEALYKDVVDYDKDPLDQAYEKMLKVVDKTNNPVFKRAFDVVEDCLQIYSSDEVCIYFDGGLESVCMLHIYYALLLQRNPVPKLQAVCIKAPPNQQELEDFINETVSRYKLQCEVIECHTSSAFRLLRDRQPKVKAVVIGNVTAQTPKLNECLKVFEENTKNSNIIWVTPLIDWKLDDLQKFVTSLTLPYPEGHGSFGSIDALLAAVNEINKGNEKSTLNAK